MGKQDRHKPSRNKRYLALVMVLIISISTLVQAVSPVEAEAAAKKTTNVETWGVFIGQRIKPSSKRFKNYKNIVIDAQFYSKKDITQLKKGGRKVYSYLSIGSMETYRPYYNYFQKFLLGNYNNWDEEHWIDVSQKEWQDYVINSLVRSYRKKGINGLWIDNTDVYYEYPTDDILSGLVNILYRIRQKKIPVIINGGDVFVSKLIETGSAWLIKGVMQEEVLTRIADYNLGKFAWQTTDDYYYFTEYCTRVKMAGLSVSLLEYARSKKAKKTILRFCKKNGYTVYIADNVQLK